MMILSIYTVIYSFFFFKQKTAYEMRISDWSSDVCSSDLDARKKEPEDAGSSWKIRGARPAGGKRAGVDRLFARRDARRTDRRRGRRRGRLDRKSTRLNSSH